MQAVPDKTKGFLIVDKRTDFIINSPVTGLPFVHMSTAIRYILPAVIGSKASNRLIQGQFSRWPK